MKKKRGNSIGFKIFDFYLSLGVKHAYALLYFVAFHYLIFDRKAVKTTGEYVDVRFNSPPFFSRLKHIYRIFLNTGKNLIDLRQLERDSNKVHMECDTRRTRELLKEGNGLLMLTAHTGNWQVMMRNLPELGVKINIVMLPEENPAVKEYLQIDEGEKYEINIIDPSKGADAAIEIMQELAKGNIVSIMGDRILKESKTQQVDFFDSSIELPEGPYLIASSAKAPIVFLLTRRNGPCNYTLEVNEIEREKGKEKNTSLLARKYTKILEKFLKKNPYEWTPAGKV